MSDTKINTQTVIIAVVISVILSQGISYMKPSIIGPMGPRGPSGPTGPPGPGFGELLYDSGWLDTTQGKYTTICTLDDLNVFVYMIGRIEDSINQRFYGGEFWYEPYQEKIVEAGAFWEINEYNELRVYRKMEDYDYNKVRVLVWQLPS